MSPNLSKRRARRIAIVVALGGALALGAAGLAQAADVPKPSGSAGPSGARQAPDEVRGPREHKPHLGGTVKSITDTQIMITDRDGFTRQINITAKPDGVAVGSWVHAEGTVNADGVSLDATSVMVAPEGAGPRGFGPGHRGGPGGPGRFGGPRGEGVAPPAPGGSAPAPSGSAPAPVPSAGK